MANLTLMTESGEERYPLEATTVTLGRGLESDIRLKDIKASRRHCQIVRTAEGFQVVDLSSGNGTYVNGVQVKSQLLHPGDKIQIGSTTLTFDEASSARPVAEVRAHAGGPESTKSGQPAVAASAQPVSRRAGASSGGSRPSPSESSRTSVPPASRPSPTRKLTAARTGASSRSHPVVSSDPARTEGRRKKSGPAALIIVGIGVVFAGVVGTILLTSSGDSSEQLRSEVKKLSEEAGSAEKAGKLDEAERKYREVLDRIEGKDKFKGDAVRVKASLKEIEERRTLRAAVGRRFTEIKAKAAGARDEAASQLAHEARQLLSDAGGADFAAELKELVDRLEKASGGGRRAEFQSRRGEIREKHGLATPHPRYAEAILDWQAWAGEKNATEDDRQKASAELRAINQQAKDELGRLKIRAVSLEKDNKKAEAAEELKKQRDRFEKTDCAEELEGVIEQLEK